MTIHDATLDWLNCKLAVLKAHSSEDVPACEHAIRCALTVSPRLEAPPTQLTDLRREQDTNPVGEPQPAPGTSREDA